MRGCGHGKYNLTVIRHYSASRWHSLCIFLLRKFQYLNEALARLYMISLTALMRQLIMWYSGEKINTTVIRNFLSQVLPNFVLRYLNFLFPNSWRSFGDHTIGKKLVNIWNCRQKSINSSQQNAAQHPKKDL